jgi:hypothetical protein
MTEAANLFHKHLRDARKSAATHGTNGRVDPTQKRLRDAQRPTPHKRTIQ